MFARLIVFLAAAICASPVLACVPWVEERTTGAILHAHSDALKECTVDETVYQHVIGNWLRARSPEAAKLTSLALGRAVTYPWLSLHMADAARGKPKPLQGSKLAKEVVLDPALLQRLAIPFAGSHYKVEKISYEKVLFGPAAQHSSNKRAGSRPVPFDALLWLQLTPRQ